MSLFGRVCWRCGRRDPALHASGGLVEQIQRVVCCNLVQSSSCCKMRICSESPLGERDFEIPTYKSHPSSRTQNWSNLERWNEGLTTAARLHPFQIRASPVAKVPLDYSICSSTFQIATTTSRLLSLSLSPTFGVYYSMLPKRTQSSPQPHQQVIR